MVPSEIPVTQCPTSLAQKFLQILRTHPVPFLEQLQVDPGLGSSPPASNDCLYEQYLDLNGNEYDEFVLFVSRAFGRPFTCSSGRDKIDHLMAFAQKPKVTRFHMAKEARHYQVYVQLMKLPTAPGAGGHRNSLVNRIAN